MSAIDQLLARLRRIDEAVDFITSPPVGTSSAVTDVLSRGVGVEGFICFEQFLSDRSIEWASSLSAARIAPSTLPDGSKRFEDRVIQVLPRLLQAIDVTQRASLIDEIGQTLMSLSSGTLVAHRLAFSWSGPNVHASDVELILALVGVKPNREWAEITALWNRVDQRFPGNTSAKSLFESFARLRHDAAHLYAANLPLANLSTMTRNIRLIGMCIDILVSEGLRKLRSNPSSTEVRASTIAVRRVVRDGQLWPEYAPGKQRAYRRHPSLTVALDEASIRAAPRAELVLALDGSEIIDWRFPAL
jgi:hypothetical protein